MATGAVLQYLREVYAQPSIYNVWNRHTPTTNNTHNISLTYENTELFTVQDESSELPMSAAHFGLATGLLAILLNSHLLSSKLLKTDGRVNKYQQWAEALILRVILALSCLLLSATLAPLVFVTFLFLAFYRQFVHLFLSFTNSSFACLLEGTDAVWALEDDASKSIINVLAFFEVEIVDNVFKPQLLGMLRRLMRERILTSPDSCPKFWQYRRRSRLGYFYWERQEEVRVEDHVQYMTLEDDVVNLDAPDLSEDCFRQEYYGMSESVLKGLVSELANSPLPFDNAASWEILVGRDPILEDLEVDPFEAMEEGNPEASGRYRRYPVLFRVHHSMGDGVALIKLLLETLADKQDTSQTQGVVTARILGYDNEEATRLTRRKTLSRLDSIDLIKCSTGSFDDVTRENKARRPSFLDLSLESLESSIKKVKAGSFVPETVNDELNESVEIFVDNSLDMFFTSTPKSFDDVSEDCEMSGEDLLVTREDIEDVYLRDLYCYPVTETVVSLDDAIRSASEIVLNHNKKTIFFDNTPNNGAGTPPGSGVQMFRDQSPPRCKSPLPPFTDEPPPSPPRCKSPLPPFRRDASRIIRVLDEIIESKSKPKTQFSKNDSTGSESSVAINLDGTSRRDSVFLMDNSPPVSTPRGVAPGYDAKTFARTESPVPKIHRKKYPAVFDDQDSPPVPRRDSFSRPCSPFLQDNSPVPYHAMGEPQHPRKNALRQQSDGLGSRSASPLQTYHPCSSTPRAQSPLALNHTPVVRRDDSPPRCHSPILKNNVNIQNDSNTPFSLNESPVTRCDSPFMRSYTPLPRNENPIPRCNSPFMRNNTPLPRNENPIPRCNSPFMRNNTPLPSNEKPFSRCESPLMRNNGVMPHGTNNDSPTNKSKLTDRKTPLYLTNRGYNPSVNDLPSKPGSRLIDKAVNGSTAQFIRGHFFSPDGEVINRSSVSPNCFVRLLDDINHRPGVLEHVGNYVKNACALVFAPASIIHQTMVKAADVNPIHGPDLSGQKVVSWYLDSNRDKSENLLSTIKRVKGRMAEARFTDVFLSALSSSLESYFVRSGCDRKCIPDTLSVVIPVRMTTQKEIEEAMKTETEAVRKIPEMENKFSVALLSLPITSMSTETNVAKPFSPIGRLREICKHTDLLRKSPDYHVNYWLMRVVSTYLPVPLLVPVLSSTQSTMVVSNLVGPPSQLELGGYHLKDIVFWVPNRGSTGVGVSVLSYADRLQIGIVADRALLPCQQDANIIIEGIVSELECLDGITAPVKKQPLKA